MDVWIGTVYHIYILLSLFFQTVKCIEEYFCSEILF